MLDATTWNTSSMQENMGISVDFSMWVFGTCAQTWRRKISKVTDIICFHIILAIFVLWIEYVSAICFHPRFSNSANSIFCKTTDKGWHRIDTIIKITINAILRLSDSSTWWNCLVGCFSTCMQWAEAQAIAFTFTESCQMNVFLNFSSYLYLFK